MVQQHRATPDHLNYGLSPLSQRDEETGGWRKFNNEELHNLYSLPNIIMRIIKLRRVSWAGHVAQMKRRGMHIDFGEKARRKEPLGRHRHRWEDNIKMNLGEMWWGGNDWIHLAQDRDSGGLL
jgi:hypothetical protein